VSYSSSERNQRLRTHWKHSCLYLEYGRPYSQWLLEQTKYLESTATIKKLGQHLMLNICLLAAFIFAADNDSLVPVEGDEIFCASLFSCGTLSDRFMVQTANGGLNLELYIHNYSLNQTWLVRDGRLPKTGFRILPAKNSFALYGLLHESLFFLDMNGTFDRKIDLKDLSGCPNQLSVVDIFSYGDAKALLTYDIIGEDQVFLAVVDLEQRSMETLYSVPLNEPGHYSFWVPVENGVFFIDTSSGKIQVFDINKFKYGKTILVGEAKIKNPLIAKLNKNIKDHPLVSRIYFLQHLINPLPLPGGLQIEKVVEHGENSTIEEKEMLFFQLSGKKSPSTRFDVSIFSGSRFVFDADEGTLFRTQVVGTE
jgi:hypothetical protein